MVITSCEKQKHNKEKLNVYVDGEYSFSISINGWTKNYLWEGKEITQDDIDKIVIDDQKELAVSKALYILGHNMKTKHELKKKLLEKGFSENDCEYAIDKATEYGYVNDKHYCECLIKERAIPNGWGQSKVFSTLMSKGVSKEDIQESISLYMEFQTYQIALDVAKKKSRIIGNIEYNKKKQKLFQFLSGRGFSYDIIKDVLNEVMGEEEEEY